MTKAILVLMAFVLLCAGSIEASAAVPREYSDRAVRDVYVPHRNVTAMRAAVSQRPTMFSSTRPQPYPYNFHETDGLSRNPNDCAVWGCIDSN
jgi:hypothetical protein